MPKALLFDTPASLPFPLTISHYHVFASGRAREGLKDEALDSPESWDALRESDPMFSIAQTRDEWVRVNEEAIRKDGQDERLRERGKDIASLLSQKGITTLFSTGSGGAGLEYHILKNLSGLKVVCSEYAPKSVELLRNVFTEAEVIQLDITSTDWSSITARADANTTVCLMYRLDAGFTDRQWKDIFASLARAGVKQVLYIPTGFLTLRSLVSRLRLRLSWMLSGTPMVYAGHLRTKATFETYWQRHFTATEHVVGGMTGFWLTRN
jgi:hypothetical protein